MESTWTATFTAVRQAMLAVPGRVRLWPYQRGIAQAISDPGIERTPPPRSTLQRLIAGGFGEGAG